MTAHNKVLRRKNVVRFEVLVTVSEDYCLLGCDVMQSRRM
jgi:hypothetical protein